MSSSATSPASMIRRAEISSDLSFAGDTIAPAGVKSFVPRTDRVPMDYIAKVW